MDRSNLSNLSEAERKKEFFKSMNANKAKEEEAKKQARLDKLNAMDEETKAAFLQAEADEVQHQKQKDKSLK